MSSIQLRISRSAPWWIIAGFLCSMGCGFQSRGGATGDGGGGDAGGGDGSSMGDGGPTGVCYGPSVPWRVCLDATPTGSVALPATLDTDTSSLCLPAQPTGWTESMQPAACFVVGDTVAVVVTTPTKVTGSRPLVLVARTQITIANVLDAASHQIDNSTNKRMEPSGCPSAFPRDPGDGGGAGAGGGAGGSFFMISGGNGGQGGAAPPDNQGGQPAAADTSPPTHLRGGCSGQVGGAHGVSDKTAGRGGGAVYLVSPGTILIGSAINVSGAGATGAGSKTGGSGGGSGGMIFLYAQMIMTTPPTAVLMANGGGGAGGAGSGGSLNGHDPDALMSTMPTAGGGSGGNGSGGQGYPATGGALDGMSTTTTNNGGGGGGGGAGYIQTNQDLGMAKVSPPANLVVAP